MFKRILSVSYDTHLLSLQRERLEKQGYKVVSALGYSEAILKCQPSVFDLYILGNTVSTREKQRLASRFRNHSPAPIIALGQPGEATLGGIEHVASDNTEQLLTTVASLLGREVA